MPRFTSPSPLCPQSNSKFEIILLKVLSLKHKKQNQILPATIEKETNFYFSRKQSMVPLDKGLQ